MNVDGIWAKPQPQIELRKEYNKQNGITNSHKESKHVVLNSSKKTNGKLVSRKQTPYKPEQEPQDELPKKVPRIKVPKKEKSVKHVIRDGEKSVKHVIRDGEKSVKHVIRDGEKSVKHVVREKSKPSRSRKSHDNNEIIKERPSKKHDINKIKEILANIKNVKPEPIAPIPKKPQVNILPMFLKKVIINKEFNYNLDEITTKKS
jgi:vacuolar-type H+-ATPase subunit H